MTTERLEIDLARFRAAAPAAGVDTFERVLRAGGRAQGRVLVPVFGALSQRDAAEAAADFLGPRALMRHAFTVAPGRFMRVLPQALARQAERLARALVAGGGARFALMRSEARQAVRDAFVRTFDVSAVAPARRSIDVIAAAAMDVNARQQKSKPKADVIADPRAFFEDKFETEDPWGYDNAYETLKYEQTFSLLPEEPIPQAMEIACAEGRFTRMLAPRVGALLASDISERALKRAEARCADQPNVRFAPFDLTQSPYPAGLDLIIVSEVLYYLRDLAAVRAVLRKMADALAPGGRILSAHPYFIVDDKQRPVALDWGDAFGAAAIFRAMAETPGLTLERRLDTDLYGIALFRKAAPIAAPRIEKAAHAQELPRSITRHIVRGGVVTTRAEVEHERPHTVPVLMYHRIATEGPADLATYRVSPAAFEAQMRLLRRHGFHAISSAKFADHLRRKARLHGRPVLITFDDGYVDFAEAAWPILQAHDFSADVFLVTDLVGQNARWDESYGAPAPLMTWQTIARLAGEGCRFGSHMATHRDSTQLSSTVLLDEMIRSRAEIQLRTGQDAAAIAAPFGAFDTRFRYLARRCGYRTAFTTEHGFAPITGRNDAIARLLVDGAMELDAFAAMLGIKV